MEKSASCTFTCPQRKRNDKGRTSWSQREEEVLLRALKEIVANGWKSENRFKTGYLQVLEQEMLKAFPETDLRGIPHINSKIHVWKRYYSSLVSMLARSGIGWNDTSKMIEAREDAWDSYLKVDSNARLMRFKSWPYFHDWGEIFGKDRATGEHTEDLVEAVNEVLKDNEPNGPEMGENFEQMFQNSEDVFETMSSFHPDNGTENQHDTSSSSEN
ncbi:hypothetical protein PHJA_001320100 [Phtheirospermum japonicum]|uniref:Myb/SANT-like domain-containing protein n=1 Tax=Phtheirospermum japonicum TaxID=374723 RepID=A0A830CC09_9LAMI|nr:hypothetical protein PHJA_001320100 [Phtheirospermum japonicum]